jgi:hypothetical protein
MLSGIFFIFLYKYLTINVLCTPKDINRASICLYLVLYFFTQLTDIYHDEF